MTTLASLPVGFRFNPREEELVDHYLKNKIKGHDFDDIIPEVDICSYEPWDLPEFSLIESDDDEWFYFSRPDYKTKGNSRNRATEMGFWKITGVEREIKARRSKALIGKKRTLTFYKGKVRSGQKTGWVIHEYYIPEALLPSAARQRDFVLCRLKRKDESTDNGASNEGEVCQTSNNNLSDFQNLMADFGGPTISEDMQITLQENTRPEEIFATLFSSNESPQSPDYFASVLGESFLRANAGSDVLYELEAGLDDLEEGDYSLEDRSRTTRFNHSSEPKSLHKVYDESIHRQGLSTRDKNAMLLHQLLQETASSVNIAENLPRNIGRVRSVNVEEPVHVLQAEFSSDMLSRALVTGKSFQSESRRGKGEMVTTGGAEKQSEPQLPLGPDDYITQRKVRDATAQSYRGQARQGFKPQEVKYTSKAPDKPKPPPEKPIAPPERPCRNDEQKSMKQKQTATTVGDWKSSFIVWKESPLSLRSYPPVVYAWNMIGGLILFIFIFGELISYGNW